LNGPTKTLAFVCRRHCDFLLMFDGRSPRCGPLYPESGHLQCTRPCLLWANSEHWSIRSLRRRGLAATEGRLTKPLVKRAQEIGLHAPRRAAEEPDYRHPGLRPPSKRPRRRRTKQRDEFAPFHYGPPTNNRASYRLKAGDWNGFRNACFGVIREHRECPNS
jgi:hypothetical protein